MKPINTVSIWNPKGGQGKSMIAINLAASAVQIGLKPILVDQSPQGTLKLYEEEGHLPFDVLLDYPKSKKIDADLMLVDHAAHDRDIPTSPVLVMPVIPQRSQYAKYIDAKNRAKSVGKRIITVVTNGDKRREQERNTILSLQQQGAFEIPASGVFTRADNTCRTIFDPTLNNTYGIRDRRREFAAILSAVLKSLQLER